VDDGAGEKRFTELKRGISQRMLTVTLRGLAREGVLEIARAERIDPGRHLGLDISGRHHVDGDIAVPEGRLVQLDKSADQPQTPYLATERASAS
jgi:HxlR-like helix-turn-helix